MDIFNNKSRVLTEALRFIVFELHISLRHICCTTNLNRITLSKILKGEEDTSKSYDRYMPVFIRIIETQRHLLEIAQQEHLVIKCIYLFASLFLLQFGIMLLLGR